MVAALSEVTAITPTIVIRNSKQKTRSPETLDFRRAIENFWSQNEPAVLTERDDPRMELAIRITGTMTLGDLIVGLGTLALALFTYWLGKSARCSACQMSAQLDIERERLESGDRPYVVPAPDRDWSWKGSGHKQEPLRPDDDQDHKEASQSQSFREASRQDGQGHKEGHEEDNKVGSGTIGNGQRIHRPKRVNLQRQHRTDGHRLSQSAQGESEAQGQAPQEVVRSGAGVEYSFRPSRGTLPPEGLDCFHAVEMNIRLQPHS